MISSCSCGTIQDKLISFTVEIRVKCIRKIKVKTKNKMVDFIINILSDTSVFHVLNIIAGIGSLSAQSHAEIV